MSPINPNELCACIAPAGWNCFERGACWRLTADDWLTDEPDDTDPQPEVKS